ncbi:MAG: response regulator [Nitrospirae bacterium]|nr:MAG: response regulator [Nitrospirota bacterium]
MAFANAQPQDALPQAKEGQVPVDTSQFNVPNERRQATREADSSRPTILIVEDEAGPREALKLILRPFYNLHSVDSAEAALHLLKEQAVDLVTLDLKLPGKQGAELLQDIKREHEHVEVVVITGYGSLKSAMDGLRYGASGYLLKPFNVTELIAIINQSLEKKRRLEVLRDSLRQFENAWRMRQDTSSAWKTLSALLEAKDPELVRHSNRVHGYVTRLADRLSLTPEERELVRIGAWLHDIGKFGVEERLFSSIIRQADREDEFAKFHSEVGARMVQSLALPPAVGEIIRHHHERYDGSGYPDGLKGDEIPYLARLVGLANAFDELSAGRSQNDQLPLEAAKEYVRRQAGILFDPSMVKQFLKDLR